MTRSRVNADNSQSNARSFATTTEPTGIVDGSIWVKTDGVASSIQRLRWKKTPAAGTTVFTALNDDGNFSLVYTPNYEEVFLNGVLLVRGVDYAATDGTTITLVDATVAGDVIEVFCTPNLAVTDVYTTSQADNKYLPKSLVDAKGDLYVATADNTTARLPVGGNDQVLVADSAATTGVSWKSYASQGVNKVLNSDMSIWQRGITFSSGNAFAADRWRPDSTATAARGTGPGFIPYCMDITGSVGNPAIRQSIELPAAGNAGPFQIGSTWTISFYAKTSTSVTSQLTFYAAFLDSLAAGGGNPVTVVGGNSLGVPSTSWGRFSTTFTIAASPAGTNLALSIVPYLNTGAYAGTFSITGIQLEPGSAATPFQTATGNYATELMLCQRHYSRWTAGATYARFPNWGIAAATVGAQFPNFSPVTMRVSPYALEFGGNFRLYDTVSVTSAVSSFTILGTTELSPTGWFNAVSTGLTQYRTYTLNGSNDATAYIGFTADL
jgi:hypothetical protein